MEINRRSGPEDKPSLQGEAVLNGNFHQLDGSLFVFQIRLNSNENDCLTFVLFLSTFFLVFCENQSIQ